MDRPIERADATIVAAVTRDCIERKREKGIDVDAYNTRESAADLMALREFLGAEKITLWGISYGSHLALATMKYHGEQIDRVILAGLEGLHHTWKLPHDQQALLEEIARLVSSDSTVSAAVPDLIGSIKGLLAELERSPKTVRLTHPIEGQELDVVVGKLDLQMALAASLRGPSLFAGVPDAIARMEQGDWVVLALASGQRRTGEGIHSMTVAMDCASGADQKWRERIASEARATILGDAINFPMYEICNDLGIADLGDDFRAPVVSSIPALLISGTLDGRTPPDNAKELLPGLSKAQHLVIDGAGHSDPLFLSSPKILEVMQAFMRDEDLPITGIALPPVEFATPKKIHILSKEELLSYVGSYKIENSKDVRKVIKAGDILYTRRAGGPPLPIRPTSETEFFYEGSTTHLQFQIDDNGDVAGMMMYHDGAEEGEFARRR